MSLATRLHVFVSYSSHDREFALAVQQRLEALGRAVDGRMLVGVWVDQYGIAPGRRWRDEIETALREADIAALLVSPKSLASRFVVREVRLMLQDQSKPGDCLLPLRYRQVNRKKLRWAAREFSRIVDEFQWIDLVGIAPPFTDHPGLPELDSHIERYWRAKIERQRSPTCTLMDEKRFICDLFQIPHPWTASYFAWRVRDLMTGALPDPGIAQYYVHALKFSAAPNKQPVLGDLIAWWRGRFPDKVMIALLEQALLVEKPPACY